MLTMCIVDREFNYSGFYNRTEYEIGFQINTR